MGCTEIHPYKNKLKHEEFCRFRPYNCPYAGSECLITGDVPFLVSHLINDHKVDLHEGCTFNHRYVKPNPYEVENATWMLTVSKMTLLFMFKYSSVYYRYMGNIPGYVIWIICMVSNSAYALSSDFIVFA